jgi:hypothetical protein
MHDPEARTPRTGAPACSSNVRSTKPSTSGPRGGTDPAEQHAGRVRHDVREFEHAIASRRCANSMRLASAMKAMA